MKKKLPLILACVALAVSWIYFEHTVRELRESYAPECGILDGFEDGRTEPCHEKATHFEPFCEKHWKEYSEPTNN